MKRKKDEPGLLQQLKKLFAHKQDPPLRKEDEEEGGGLGGAAGGKSGFRGRLSFKGVDPFEEASILVDDSPSMDRRRREAEQSGHRQLARVHAREHNLETRQSAAPEGELQNSILQHPWLDGQRFDGIDPNVNPAPPLNTDARREFDNERREQEMEKQLRLGNMPTFNKTPKPGQQ